jgi:peptidoglycan/LPS O-acetylase OafA/YrhL
MRYNPALDGLRALAAMAVLLFHTHFPLARGGYVGVDAFFVLSGFLITTILASEYSSAGRIDFAGFYVRRVRRLYPALLFMLLVYLVVAPLVWPQFDHVKGVTVAGLYLMDYWPRYENAHYIRHTWSLAAEAHFYLIWPLVLTALLARATPEKVTKRLLWIAVGATTWTAVKVYFGLDAYNSMDGRFFQLAWGGWFGMVLLTRPEWYSEKLAKPLGWAGILVLGYLVILGISGPAKMTVVAPVAALASVAAIYGAQELPIQHPILVFLGKLSYGIYLWHFPISGYMFHHAHWPGNVIVTAALSIALAWISYTCVEIVFRRWPRHAALAQ